MGHFSMEIYAPTGSNLSGNQHNGEGKGPRASIEFHSNFNHQYVHLSPVTPRFCAGHPR